MKPALAITMGDVNGIGPEILVKALARPDIHTLCRPVVVGCPAAFSEARRFAPNCPPPMPINALNDAAWAPGGVPVFDAGFAGPATRPGHLDPEAGRCAVEWTKAAVQLALDGHVAGLVTCPINKEGIHQAGYHYFGHTELIAELTGSLDYRMCLFTDTMRIVHITTHLSLREAIDAVKSDRIATTIRIAHQALVDLGLPRRRIAVAGLNPHAGEAGAFGREEITEIIPAIRQCRELGMDCSGPYPADSVFRLMREGAFDLVVAMYHDQGHVPLKLIAMDEGVNVTLGISVVRTSVDHGTAYEIAGQGIAREASLCAALRLATQFVACGVSKRGKTL